MGTGSVCAVDALRELAVGIADSERADVSLSGLDVFMAAER
ncbi:MAG TPA: hypothetical protein VH062_15450 [Polyangiaceae bacterium]|nr:hypothetical protein [Polyangiaceae bacterium]